MRSVAACCLLALFLASAAARRGRRQSPCADDTATLANGKKECDGKVLLEDQFDSFDQKQWQNEVRFPEYPDYEFLMYDDGTNNTFVKDGVLFLKPTLLSDVHGEQFLRTGAIKLDEYPNMRCTNPPGNHQCRRSAQNGFRILPPVISSKIRTYKTFRFRYGKVEIRAKMPAGEWLYSVLELIPRNNKYGPTRSGRILVASTRGNAVLKYPKVSDPRVDFGNKWLEAGAMVDSYSPTNGSISTILAQISTQGGWHKEFHTYTFTWEKDKMSWSVDGKKIGRGVIQPPEGGFLGFSDNKMAPFDEEFFITMGVAVGGVQRFPDPVTSNGRAKPWKNRSPKNMITFWDAKDTWYPTWKGDDAALQIDYIKVTAL